MISKKSIDKYFTKILFKELFIIVLIPFVLYTSYKKISEPILLIKLLFGCVFCWLIIYGVPLFLLFFNHKKYSKNISFVKNRNGEFTYYNNKTSLSFTSNEIKGIELWLPPTTFDKRVDWLFIGSYHYCNFFLKNGKNFSVSCLIYDEIEKDFSKELIINRKKFFPLISTSKIQVNNNWDYLKAKSLEKGDVENNYSRNFTDKFRNKSKEELQYIVNNSNLYQAEAVEEAKILLEEM